MRVARIQVPFYNTRYLSLKPRKLILFELPECTHLLKSNNMAYCLNTYYCFRNTIHNSSDICDRDFSLDNAATALEHFALKFFLRDIIRQYLTLGTIFFTTHKKSRSETQVTWEQSRTLLGLYSFPVFVYILFARKCGPVTLAFMSTSHFFS